MPKFYIEFGVTVYHSECIEAPDINAARNVAYALDCNTKFLNERLRPSWSNDAGSVADDYTDVDCIEVGMPYESDVTMDADALGEYLSPIEMRDYRKACIEPEIEKAMESDDWKRVAELASELAKED